jgi:hypothetical protein
MGGLLQSNIYIPFTQAVITDKAKSLLKISRKKRVLKRKVKQSHYRP